MKKLVVDCETGAVEEVDLTADEVAEIEQAGTKMAWDSLRVLRNIRLSESDWTVLTDTPTSTAAWKVYRQALRDLPANTNDPLNPVWPTPPT